MVNDVNSLSHTKWNCKYHIVFAPKYRRKVFYGEKKREIGEILRTLCEWKKVKIIEAEVCPDYIHMLATAGTKDYRHKPMEQLGAGSDHRHRSHSPSAPARLCERVHDGMAVARQHHTSVQTLQLSRYVQQLGFGENITLRSIRKTDSDTQRHGTAQERIYRTGHDDSRARRRIPQCRQDTGYQQDKKGRHARLRIPSFKEHLPRDRPWHKGTIRHGHPTCHIYI